MNCEKIETFIHIELDGEISAEDEAILQQHLTDCENCRTEYSRQKSLKRVFSENRDALPDPTPGFTDRVMDTVRSEGASQHSRPRQVGLWAGRSRPLAMAACLLVLLGGSFWLGGIKKTEAASDRLAREIREEVDSLVRQGVDPKAAQALMDDYWRKRKSLNEESNRRNDELYEQLEREIDRLRQGITGDSRKK